MRSYLIPFGLAVACTMAHHAEAQSRARIWNVDLGGHVSELPTDEWVDPACGTNGGPPSIPLDSFADFARCPAEEATGLHEVWFIYDDEWEYIARAYRDPREIRAFSANVFYGQPIITSLLIDGDGLVQGYRVVTDARADTDVRMEAYTLHGVFKTLFTAAPWQCTELEREERELPVEGRFLKENCVMVSDDLFVRSQGRHLRKPGQDVRNIPGLREFTQTYFESSARLDVLRKEAVSDAPCCAEYLPQ